MFFILFLSPLPPGGPGRVRTVIFLRASVVFGRFRPGSEGNLLIFMYKAWGRGPKQSASRRVVFCSNHATPSANVLPYATFCNLRPAGGPILRFFRLESGRNPALMTDFRSGSTIAQHRVDRLRAICFACIEPLSVVGQLPDVTQ